MITSIANAKIKLARRLARKKERSAHHQFLVEGVRLVEEAERAGFVPALVFYTRAAFDTEPRVRQLITRLERRVAETYLVSENVMRALAATETPQGIAAVYPLPLLPLPPQVDFVLVLDRVRDPGNLGTILRTAWAAGLDVVYLAPETVDAFNPKVVRAAAGAHFFIPIQALTWDEIASRLARFPRVYLADAHGQLDYSHADWSVPRALIIGGEAEGASEHARRLATTTVSIPMPGRAESLNAAIAAGILLFHAIRQNM